MDVLSGENNKSSDDSLGVSPHTPFLCQKDPTYLPYILPGVSSSEPVPTEEVPQTQGFRRMD